MATLSRELAFKLGRWLVGKERQQEALAVFCVGAVSGPNDSEGQKLVAQALRIVANAPLAKAAFERMEGLQTDQSELEAEIARLTPEEIAKLEKEMARPLLFRAQVGFNNNLKYKERSYHVQTEDSGLERPHVITHLFADGGRVIKSHKRVYAKEVERADIAPFVRQLMKAQHMEMVLALREGRFDNIIAGKERGGILDVLTEAPQVDMQQRGKKADHSAEAEAAAGVVVPAAEVSLAIRVHLRVLRSQGVKVERYEPAGDDVVIGKGGAVPLDGERFCHPKEAVIHYRGGELFLEDLDGGNGVFIRMRRPVELELGDEFVVGDQLLRVEKNPERDDAPGPGPTYMWSSPQPNSNFRVVQILEGGVLGTVQVAGGTTLQIGSEIADMILPNDPLVAARHCWVEEQAGTIVLTEIHAKTGTFVRIRGEQKLVSGDELLVGRTRLRVEIPTAQA